MKQALLKFYIFFAVIVFTCTVASAQKNFEGKITFRLISMKDNSRSKEQIVYLKGDKVFIDFGNKTESPNALYDFAKGIEYKFMDDSIAVTTKLSFNLFPYSSTAETGTDSVIEIQKNTCHKKSSVIMPPMNQYFKSVENWFPVNIVFKTNAKSNFVTPPLIYFNEQTISLKTRIRFTEKAEEQIDLDIEATEIKEMPLSDSIFTIPAAFKTMSLTEYSSMIIEKFKSIDNSLDSNSNPEQKKPPQNTHNQPTKSSATKPKE
ncbi:MAG: hypothetical protein V4685_09245 [Bacteroidota bacterium]